MKNLHESMLANSRSSCMESVLRKLIIGLSALFGRSRWEEGMDVGCYVCMHVTEQCHNVLQSFGECHNVTWPICISAMFRGITNPRVTSIVMKRSPVDYCNNAIEQMHRIKRIDRKCSRDH